MIAAANEDGHMEGTHSVPKTRVDHSSAGAQWAIKKFGLGFGGLLAYVVAGHHAGLPDWSGGPDGRHGLSDRLGISDGLQRALAANPSPNILEMPTPKNVLPSGADVSLWVRMLASAVFDADFLDTESFFNPQRTKARDTASWPPIGELAERLMQTMSQTFGPPVGMVNKLRAEVLSSCRAAAQWKPGLFSLTVPTGGGKTLASLAFALDHAKTHGKARVIYAIPFTSIIEQTAGVFREFLGDDTVLEHHSALEVKEIQKETNRIRLASENWDAPLVVTTTVQLFDSLFASRTSKVRKLHNLAGSVLILDEAQTLPPAVLKPVTMILDQLVKHYNVTVVLCTATQPALRDVFKDLPDAREIIPDPARLFKTLDRVDIHMPKTDTRQNWSDIANEMAEHPQALAIVNSRADCRTLHGLLPEGAIHLSTWQCAQHRASLLKEIKTKLPAGEPVRVVSTSLIEAGVDLDFPVVLRAMTGLDSLAQAAGRCNREGKLDKGRFIAFRIEGEKSYGHVLQTTGAAEAALRDHADAPFHPAAFDAYFRELYWAKGDDALDAYEMRKLLHLGKKPMDAVRSGIQFRTAAEQFHMIDDVQETVVVSYDEKARRAIAWLRAQGPDRGALRALQRYTVPVRRDCMNRLREATALEDVHGVTVLAREKLYDKTIGLDCDAIMEMSIEELII